MSHPDDELVSSVIDGEATATERAQVEADPVLHARLSEFRDVRDLLVSAGVPADLAATARERALAAFAAEQAAADTVEAGDAPPAPVISINATRRASRGRPARTRRALGVAAAVLLALIGFGALVQSRDSGSDYTAAGSLATAEADTAQSNRAGASASPDTSAMEAAPPQAGASGATLREATAPVDLGQVGDLAALGEAWRAATGQASSSSAGTSSAGTSAAPTATAASAATDTASACGAVFARATLAGRPVVLVASAGTISVLDAVTCTALGTIPA